MTTPKPRRLLDVNALAKKTIQPEGAVERFVALHGPVEGSEGVGAQWRADFFDMLKEAFQFGCETGRYEVDPLEGQSAEQCASRTRYADAAMVLHRHETPSNRRIADEALAAFRKHHHLDEEARRG